MKLIRILLLICSLCTVTATAASAATDSCPMRPTKEVTDELSVDGYILKFGMPVLPRSDILGARFERPDGSFAVLIIQGDKACVGFKHVVGHKPVQQQT
jgi:hypothetical protein